MKVVLEIDGEPKSEIMVVWDSPNLKDRENQLNSLFSKIKQDNIGSIRKAALSNKEVSIYFSAMARLQPKDVRLAVPSHRRKTRNEPLPAKEKRKMIKLEREPIEEEKPKPIRIPGVYSNHSHFRIAK